jgi:putative SOS response-associated peptidase YedK
MCGRTALTATPEDLREVFGLDEIPTLTPRYNVPPSMPLDVVRVPLGSKKRTFEPLRWGLIPPWANDPAIGNRLALARTETAGTNKVFREALQRHRCLVAVDGFYEWRREGKSEKIPFFVRAADSRPFALAGVWSRWVSREGEVIESCAILTQRARPPVDAIHARMPLVLPREAWDRWLDPDLTEPDDVTALFTARTPELVAYPVSAYVNDPRHDDPSCVEPRTPAQRQLFDVGATRG